MNENRFTSAFEQLVRAQMENDDTEDSPARPLAEALVETLRGAAARYAAPCPFKPGDLVTPRRGYNLKDSGEPHIVLEVFDPPKLLGPNERPASVRIGYWLDGQIVATVGEHWCYEHWVADE